jgi:hypothetical protein
VTWTLLGAGEPLVEGQRYRSTYYLGMPYSATLADTIRQAVHSASGALSLTGINLIGVGVKTPQQTSQEQGTPGGRYTRWCVIIEWKWRTPANAATGA